MMQVFLWYCVLSVAIGLCIAARIRYDRWLHDTKRRITYSPNKDSLGYLIAAVVGCPVINIIAIAVILASWESE